MTANEVIRLLGLQPLEPEGGYFAETFRSPLKVTPDRSKEPRAASTAIYYLLTASSVSRLHRLKHDELWHFYLGDTVEMVQLEPDRPGRVVELGSDVVRGQSPQVLVRAGVWQGARLKAGGQWALMGCTVAPGFEFADFEVGDRQQLRSEYPDFHEWIDALT